MPRSVTTNKTLGYSQLMVSWNNWFPVLAWTQPAARAVKLNWNWTFPSDCLLLSIYKLAISSSWYSMIGLKRSLAGRIEEVILELVRTKCTPILLCGLECFQKNKAKRYSLDFTFSRLCMKLFKTRSTDVVRDCQSCIAIIYIFIRINCSFKN